MPECISHADSSHRLNVLAGVWDPANGTALPARFDEELKWWALLFKHVIVPEKYFSCYGPLFSRLGALDLLSQDIETTDTVLALLRAGVIVPAVTFQSDGFAWTSLERGDRAGLRLQLSTEDGERYQQRLHSFVTYWTRCTGNDPGRLVSPDGNNVRFTEVVDALITTPGAFLDQQLSMIPKAHKKAGVETVLSRLCCTLRETVARHGDRLLRRHLEEAVFTSISSSFPALRFRDIYDLGRAKVSGRHNPVLANATRNILAGIATVYHVRESWRWRAAGSLVRGHDPALVEAMHGPQPIPAGTRSAAKMVAWMGHQIDLSNVAIRDIIEFRRSGTFSRYCVALEHVKVSLNGVGFIQQNPEFWEFLTVEYLPAIRRLVEKNADLERRETAKKVVERVVSTACTTAGLALSSIIAERTNHVLESWNVHGLGHVLKIGGEAFVWVLSTFAGVKMGGAIERAIQPRLSQRTARQADKDRTANYIWR